MPDPYDIDWPDHIYPPGAKIPVTDAEKAATIEPAEFDKVRDQFRKLKNATPLLYEDGFEGLQTYVIGPADLPEAYIGLAGTKALRGSTVPGTDPLVWKRIPDGDAAAVTALEDSLATTEVKASTALANAATATTTATTADGKADAASTAATAADSKADTAIAAAATADSKAVSAQSTADTADSRSTTALNAANNAQADATNAVITAAAISSEVDTKPSPSDFNGYGKDLELTISVTERFNVLSIVSTVSGGITPLQSITAKITINERLIKISGKRYQAGFTVTDTNVSKMYDSESSAAWFGPEMKIGGITVKQGDSVKAVTGNADAIDVILSQGDLWGDAVVEVAVIDLMGANKKATATIPDLGLSTITMGLAGMPSDTSATPTYSYRSGLCTHVPVTDWRSDGSIVDTSFAPSSGNISGSGTGTITFVSWAIEQLDLDSIGLTSILLSDDNIAATILDIDRNPLLTAAPESKRLRVLKELHFWQTSIVEMDIRGLRYLERVTGHQGDLVTLKSDYHPNLSGLVLYANPELVNLDVRGMTQLADVRIYDTGLSDDAVRRVLRHVGAAGRTIDTTRRMWFENTLTVDTGDPEEIEIGRLKQSGWDMRYSGTALDSVVRTPTLVTEGAGSPPVPIGLTVATHSTGVANADYQVLASTGASYMRTDAFWSQRETVLGIYDWTGLDSIVNGHRIQGVGSLIILDYGNLLYENNASFGITTQVGRDGFEAFCVAAVNHYAGQNVIFEVWNEPNSDNFWGADVGVESNTDEMAAEYLLLCQQAVPAMRTAQPDAVILVGAMAGMWEVSYAWFTYLAQNNIFDLEFDGWSVHAYNRSQPEDMVSGPMRDGNPQPEGMSEGYSRLRQIMVAEHGSEVPIYGTESGMHVVNNIEGMAPWVFKAIRREYQASHAVRLYLSDMAAGLKTTTWYVLRQNGGQEKFTMMMNDVQFPVIEALRVMTNELAGFSFTTKLTASLPPIGRNFVYQMDDATGRRTLVAHTAPAGEARHDAWQAHDMQITGLAGVDSVVGIYGEAIEGWSFSAGTLTIPVTHQPVYARVL